MKKSKILICAVLLLSSNKVSAQFTTDGNCISLQGSTSCPAFTSFYVDTNQQQFTFLQNVTNSTTFDAALNDYVSSPDLYLSVLGCSNKADTTASISYARYSLTYMCATLIQDSLSCNYQYNLLPPPLCQSTCFDYTNSVNQITNNTVICPNQLEQASRMENLNSSCVYWSGLNGTTDCIIGLANEPQYCGYSTQASGCSFCKSNTNACCDSFSCSSLSPGGIAGVVIGCLAFISLIAATLFWFCFKKKKRPTRKYSGFMMSDKKPADDSSSALGYDVPSHKQEISTINTTPTPMEEFYQVKHPYPPQMGDELGLHIGDIICVAMNFDDGWALGFNVTTGLKGVFPLVCVAPAPEELLEQLLQADQPTSKILIEDEAQLQQLRDSIHRSMSVASKRSINTLPVSELTHHNSIPRRTASIMRNTYEYHDLESPTSPTLHTPLVDSIVQPNHHSSFSSTVLSHPEPALFQPVETFEMYRKNRASQ